MVNRRGYDTSDYEEYSLEDMTNMNNSIAAVSKTQNIHLRHLIWFVNIKLKINTCMLDTFLM